MAKPKIKKYPEGGVVKKPKYSVRSNFQRLASDNTSSYTLPYKKVEPEDRAKEPFGDIVTQTFLDQLIVGKGYNGLQEIPKKYNTGTAKTINLGLEYMKTKTPFVGDLIANTLQTGVEMVDSKYAKGGETPRKPIVVNNPNDKRYATGGKVPKPIDNFNKKYKTNYKDLYEFTGVNDRETKEFFKGVDRVDPATHYALYKEHLAYGKPTVTQKSSNGLFSSKGAASYDPIVNKIYLHNDKPITGGEASDRINFKYEKGVRNYVAELAHSAQRNSSSGIVGMKTKFIANDLPTYIKNTYNDLTISDDWGELSDEDFTKKYMSSPYETKGTLEHEAHSVIEPYIIKDVERKKQEYIMKTQKMKYPKGGQVPQYGNGSTIGSLLGAGVGALGFIGGPQLGMAGMSLGSSLGAKVGSSFDEVESPVNPPAPYTVPSITMKGMGVNQNIYANGGMMGNPNAEIELGEVARMPNGQTLIADAPSHENGGLQLNLPAGTQISSDRLKSPLTGNTFAKDQAQLERAKAKINNTLKYRTNDKYAKKAIDILDKESNKMFEIQERSKLLEGIKMHYKNGGTVPQYGMGDTIDGNMLGLGIGALNTGMQFANSFMPEKIDRIRNNEYNNSINNYSNAVDRQRGLTYNVNDMLNEARSSEAATNTFINRNLSSGSVRTGARLGNRAIGLNNTNRIMGDANRANLGIQQTANQMQTGLSELRGNLGAQDAAYATDYRNMNLQQKANMRKIRSSALSDLSKNFQLYGRDEELMKLLPLMYPNSNLNVK